MKTADFLYLADEPASFAWGAVTQLQRHGICATNIPMAQEPAKVAALLKASTADAIVMISPYQYARTLLPFWDEIRALGKPIIAVASEHTYGDAKFRGYAQFHEERDWADVYIASQDSDTAAFRARGKRAFTVLPWVATDIFTPGPPITQRVQKFAFIGHTHDYVAGMYTERRRILEAFDRSGRLDILQIPRSISTVEQVASAWRTYAGVLCPPANGRCHSIRNFEAAASGALVVDVGQPVDPGSLFLHAGQHCVTLPADMRDEELTRYAQVFDFCQHAGIAADGQSHVRSRYAPEVVWPRLLAEADTALRG